MRNNVTAVDVSRMITEILSIALIWGLMCTIMYKLILFSRPPNILDAPPPFILFDPIKLSDEFFAILYVISISTNYVTSIYRLISRKNFKAKK